MHLKERDQQVRKTLFKKCDYQKIGTLNQPRDLSGSLEILSCRRQSSSNYADFFPIRKTNALQKHALYCKLRISKVDFPTACNCARTRCYPMKVSFDFNSLWDDISVEEVRKVSESRSACVTKYQRLPLTLPRNFSVTQKISKTHRQRPTKNWKTQRISFESTVLSDRDIPRNHSSIAKNGHLDPVYRMLNLVNPNLQSNKNLRESDHEKHSLAINAQSKLPVQSIIDAANRIRILKKGLE